MGQQNTSLLLRSPSDLLYNYYLSSAYKSAWIYEPSLPLARDPDIWEVVRRDPVILSAMDRRNRALVRPWHVEPPKNSKSEVDKRVAGIVEDALGQIHGFDAARRRLADAHYLGRIYLFIEGDYKFLSLDGNADMVWWVPTGLVDIDRRRFHFVADWKGHAAQRHKTTHLELYSTDRGRWEVVDPSFRRALIEYTYGNSEDRVGYGRGLLEATYFYHYFKTMTFERLQQGIDRWANGILVGKLDGGLNGSTTKTNEDLRTGMKSLLQNMRTEHIVVLQKEDEIEVVETSGTGHEMALSTIRYLDESIERLYNGSIRPSGHGGTKTGARAASETEEDTSEAFYQDDRDDLDEVIDNYLVRMFFTHPRNRANLARLRTPAGASLASGRKPKFHSRQEKKEDPKNIAEVAVALLGQGVPLIKKELYERTGWTAPGPGDEIVEAKSLALPGEGDILGGGPPGIGGGPGGFGDEGDGANRDRGDEQDIEPKRSEENPPA